MGRGSRGICLLASLVGVLLPLGAHASSPRYATLFAEAVDGESRLTSSSELALTRSLIQAGLVFVDEAQSRKIRSVTTAGRVMADGVPDVITGLDADVLIVGITEVAAVESRLLKGRAARMEAATEAKLIAVDSGEILAAFTTRGSAVSLSKREAARNAAEESGKALAEKVRAIDPKPKPRRVELTVEGELDLQALDGLVTTIRGLPEVKAAKVLHAGRQTKVEIVTEAPARRIAGRLTPSVKIAGYTGRSIRAVWAEGPAPGSTPRLTTARGPAKRRSGGRRSPITVKLGFDTVVLTAPGRSKQRIQIRSDEPLEGVEVAARLEGHERAPAVIPVGHLDPKEDKSIPLRLSIDPERARRIDRATQAVLSLVVSYRSDGRPRSERFRRRVTVQKKNAIDWDDDAALAAFVTHESRPIRGLGAALVQRIDSKHPLALPAAAFLALRNVRPVPDPSPPYRAETLDYVQFPVETLRAGSGDCDDLAALYAAVLESVGRAVAFLFVPNHVFVAVDTGLYTQAYRHISPDRERLITHDGRLWLPLETSDPSRSFTAAWDRGAQRIAQSRKMGEELRLVEVRRAWSRYPPVDLASPASVATPPLDEIAGDTRRALAAVRQRLTEAARRSEAEIRSAPSARLHLERGLLAAATGSFERAEAEFRAALALDVGNTAARVDLAALSLARGDIEEARRAHDRLLSAGFVTVESALNAALAAWAAGDKAAFAERISDALEAGRSKEDRRKVGLILKALKPKRGSRGSDSEDGTKIIEELVFWR